jgi:hypothetical protein
MQRRALKLTYPHFHIKHDGGRKHLYRVVQVQNSIDYEPGQLLTKEDVAALCEKVSWTITILAPPVTP